MLLFPLLLLGFTAYTWQNNTTCKAPKHVMFILTQCVAYSTMHQINAVKSWSLEWMY